MKRNSSSETVKAVGGNVQHLDTTLMRTPLHIEFGSGPKFVSPEHLSAEDMKDLGYVNAIGSRCLGSDVHLPVLDADCGATTGVTYGGAFKTVLGANRKGRYTPKSQLRDILGVHGVSLEVFSEPDMEYSSFSGETLSRGMRVSALVLTSHKPIFDVVPSSTRGSAHVYVQEPFGPTEHALLLQELTEVGVLSQKWLDITKQEEMGIVRTPWVAKTPVHIPT